MAVQTFVVCPLCTIGRTCPRDCYRSNQLSYDHSAAKRDRSCCEGKYAIKMFYTRCHATPPRSFCSRFCLYQHAKHTADCRECHICGVNMEDLEKVRICKHPVDASRYVVFCGRDDCLATVSALVGAIGWAVPQKTLRWMQHCTPHSSYSQICCALDQSNKQTPEALMKLMQSGVSITREEAIHMLAASMASCNLKQHATPGPCSQCKTTESVTRMACGICPATQPIMCQPCLGLHVESNHPVIWKCAECESKIRAEVIKPYARCRGCGAMMCSESCVQRSTERHKDCGTKVLCTRCQKRSFTVEQGGTPCGMCPVRHCSVECMEAHWAEFHKKADVASDGQEACTICMHASKNATLVPCGHRFCLPCVEEQKTCPMCRAVVRECVRTY